MSSDYYHSYPDLTDGGFTTTTAATPTGPWGPWVTTTTPGPTYAYPTTFESSTVGFDYPQATAVIPTPILPTESGPYWLPTTVMPINPINGTGVMLFCQNLLDSISQTSAEATEAVSSAASDLMSTTMLPLAASQVTEEEEESVMVILQPPLIMAGVTIVYGCLNRLATHAYETLVRVELENKAANIPGNFLF